MNSNDIAKQKRPLGDDDDGDSSSNGAGRCGGPDGERSSHGISRGGKHPRIGHHKEESSRGSNTFGNYQPATNDKDKSLQETIRKLQAQLQARAEQIQARAEQIQARAEQIQARAEQMSRFSFETLWTANAENFKVENATSLFSHAKDNHFGAQTVFDTKFQQSGPDRAIVGAMIRPSSLVQKFRIGMEENGFQKHMGARQTFALSFWRL